MNAVSFEMFLIQFVHKCKDLFVYFLAHGAGGYQYPGQINGFGAGKMCTFLNMDLKNTP